MADKKTAKAPKEQKVDPKKVAEIALSELEKQAYPYKVTKIIVNPKRKMALKAYENVELSAGMEITFSIPQEIDSPLITEAFEKATEKLQQEFRRQLNAFGTKKKEGESK